VYVGSVSEVNDTWPKTEYSGCPVGPAGPAGPSQPAKLMAIRQEQQNKITFFMGATLSVDENIVDKILI
jgi:hypothetical protein